MDFLWDTYIQCCSNGREKKKNTLSIFLQYTYKREAGNGFSGKTCPFMIEKDINTKNGMCEGVQNYSIHIPFLVF